MLTDQCQKVTIHQFVNQAVAQLKPALVQMNVEFEGLQIQLTTSPARFNGKRLWFLCPLCTKRVAVLYRMSTLDLGCRRCLGLKYRRQRYKGMIESQIESLK